MKNRYYVAYGSNLNVRQMMGRCPGAVPIGVSEIEGYELLFKGSKTGSYLTIERRKGKRVPVGIWAVSEENELALDHYEGYPTFYYKKEITLPIRYDNGETEELDCFVYIMHEERPLGVPSTNYVYTCVEGYRDFGFDPKPLITIFQKSRKENARHAGKCNFRWF